MYNTGKNEAMSSYGKCIDFPINFPQRKNATKPMIWGKSGKLKIKLFP